MSRSIQLPYEAYATAYLQTDLFLEYFFFCERKTLPAQSRNGGKLASCDWSCTGVSFMEILSKNRSVYEKRRDRNVG